MTELWSMNIKDDPLNFVKFVFEWGKEGTPPRKLYWPKKVARKNFARYWNTYTKKSNY